MAAYEVLGEGESLPPAAATELSLFIQPAKSGPTHHFEVNPENKTGWTVLDIDERTREPRPRQVRPGARAREARTDNNTAIWTEGRP